MQIKHVVTCFLESKSKILLLRRSGKVGTYQNKWAGVSGYIEKSADEQVLIEIQEEVHLESNDIQLIKTGELLEVEDKTLKTRWMVHPYLFHVIHPEKIQIDWEHKEYKWIEPKEIDQYETVPGLKKALSLVKSDF